MLCSSKFWNIKYLPHRYHPSIHFPLLTRDQLTGACLKGWAQPPSWSISFQLLVSVISFFRSLPRFHDQMLHQSISWSILPSPVNKTPRYLNAFIWGKDLLTNWREQPTFHWQARQGAGLPRDAVFGLLKVHRTHVDWMGKSLFSPNKPCKGKELVNCPSARAEFTLFFLNLRLDNRPEPPFSIQE